MPKPGDFFIGVISFFAILLPGAVAAALLYEPLGKVFEAVAAWPRDGTTAWVTFLVLAYFLGHLIFLAGSFVDHLYDWVRRLRHPDGSGSAYQCAREIRNQMLDESELEAVNTFQFARALLTTQFPEAASDVRALEADSKFFRSLIIVFLLASIVLAAEKLWLPAGIGLALMFACFFRYYERRRKCTAQAYQYVITLHRLGKLAPAPGSNALRPGG